MQYRFPEINHINDVLGAIKDRKEFVVVNKGSYTVINYVMSGNDTFPDVNDYIESESNFDSYNWDEYRTNSLRREFRGITFDSDGNLIARKFHKFFNVGEREETSVSNIDWNMPHWVLPKLDGSMITPVKIDGNVEWHTKMGNTDIAQQVFQFVSDRPEYELFANQMLASDRTPIFEWCSRQNRIVVDYPNDNLILLAIRQNKSGEYVRPGLVKSFADEYHIPYVGIMQNDVGDPEKFIEYVRKLGGDLEGFVVAFDNGHMVKIKTDEYVRIHRAKDMLSSERKIVDLFLNNNIDDLIPILNEEDQIKIRKFVSQIVSGVDCSSSELFGSIVETKNIFPTRKDFAISDFCKNLPAASRTIFFTFWEKNDFTLDDVLSKILAMISRSLFNENKYQEIKSVFFPGVTY